MKNLELSVFILLSIICANSALPTRKYDDNIDEEEFEITPKAKLFKPFAQFSIEATHKTTTRKEPTKAQGRNFMMFGGGGGGQGILGAMMQPILMMLGMASFVSMMPSIAQNVGSMIPNLFPLVGGGAAAAAPAGKRRRRSVREGGQKVIHLAQGVLDLWDRVEKAIETYGTIQAK